jgi:hypothetical protein
MGDADQTPARDDTEGHETSIDLLYPFYLDADMSMAFAAALTGGVALEEEQVDRSSDTSKAVKAIRGNLRLWRAGSFEAGREASEGSDVTSESRLIKRHTDASIFIALYDELRRREQLRMEPPFEKMSVRDLVALDMGPAVAPLRRVVDQVIRLLDLNASTLGLETTSKAKSNVSQQKRQPQRPPNDQATSARSEAVREYQLLKSLFGALSDDLEHSGMIDIVVARGELPTAVLTLDKRFVSAPTLELLHTSRFTVVGKVSQIWSDNTEFVNLYRRSVLSLVPALAQSTAWGLLGLLAAMGRGFDVSAMQRSTNEALGIPPVSSEEQQAMAAGASSDTPEGQPPPGAEVMINPEAMSAILPGVPGPAFQILPLAICS